MKTKAGVQILDAENNILTEIKSDGEIVCNKGILLGNVTTPVDGHIRYNGTDVEACVNSTWYSLTGTGSSGNGFTPNILTVHPTHSEATYSTLTSAVNAATSTDTILVFPGVYSVSNPLTIPDDVSIIGIGEFNVSIVIANSASSNIFNVGKNVLIEGLTFSGCNGGTAKAISFSGTSSEVEKTVIRKCKFMNCYCAIYATGGPSILCVINCSTVSNGTTTIIKGFWAENGAVLDIRGFNCDGNSGQMMTNGIHVDGTSKVNISDGIIKYSTIGLLIAGGSTTFLKNCIVENNTTGIKIDSSGTTSRFESNSTTLKNNTTYDLDIQSTSIGHLFLHGISLRNDLVNNPNNVEYYSSGFSTFSGDIGHHVVGELQVGTYNQPTSTSLGSGNTYIHSMNAESNDNLEVGVWTDNSTSAASNDLSTFNLFAALGSNNCVYVGGDIEFYGIETIITTAWAANESDNAIWEYWNGTSWIEFKIMTTSMSPPYYSYTTKSFERTGSEHIRFSKLDGWVTKILDGNTKYWIRYKLTATIVSTPILEQIKLHSNQTHINPDGYQEYFGTARSIKQLPWEVNITEPSSSSPVNQDIYLSDNINIGRKENNLVDNTTSRFGFCAFVPQELDSSMGVKLILTFIGSVSSTDNILFKIRWACSNDNDRVYRSTTTAPTTSTGEQLYDMIIAYNGTDDKQQSCEYILDISQINVRPTSGVSTLLWVTIEREAGHASDTYTGDIAILQMGAYYASWCNGGSFYDW